MPTILDLYNSKKDQSFTEGGPDLKTLEGKISSLDQTPYSVGTGYAGKKDIDEDGLKAVETKNAKGNRYQVGNFGGGSEYLTNGYTDQKKYGATDKNK
jgi:hypothetical protein